MSMRLLRRSFGCQEYFSGLRTCQVCVQMCGGDDNNNNNDTNNNNDPNYSNNKSEV